MSGLVLDIRLRVKSVDTKPSRSPISVLRNRIISDNGQDPVSTSMGMSNGVARLGVLGKHQRCLNYEAACGCVIFNGGVEGQFLVEEREVETFFGLIDPAARSPEYLLLSQIRLIFNQSFKGSKYVFFIGHEQRRAIEGS